MERISHHSRTSNKRRECLPSCPLISHSWNGTGSFIARTSRQCDRLLWCLGVLAAMLYHLSDFRLQADTLINNSRCLALPPPSTHSNICCSIHFTGLIWLYQLISSTNLHITFKLLSISLHERWVPKVWDYIDFFFHLKLIWNKQKV